MSTIPSVSKFLRFEYEKKGKINSLTIRYCIMIIVCVVHLSLSLSFLMIPIVLWRRGIFLSAYIIILHSWYKINLIHQINLTVNIIRRWYVWKKQCWPSFIICKSSVFVFVYVSTQTIGVEKKKRNPLEKIN